MVALQSSSNEFLRHFWSAVLPPRAGDISFAAKASPAQKAARAQKMASYLERTHERVHHLLENVADEMAGDTARVAIVSLHVIINNSIIHPQRLCNPWLGPWKMPLHITKNAQCKMEMQGTYQVSVQYGIKALGRQVANFHSRQKSAFFETPPFCHHSRSEKGLSEVDLKKAVRAFGGDVT